VSITVCYLLERAVRISYLQRKLLGLENAFLQENNIQLRDELLIDSLTHITNRRGFDNAIAQEWDRALRNHYPLALILFDVDYFKQFNDSYGHQAGDACLTGIAAVPKSMIGRAGDSVARYGGEEFIVTLIGTSLEDARLFAEDMCERVMELSIPHKSSQVADVVTISCGVAAIVPDQATRYEDLIKLADNALYESKRNGRNRVTCASPSPKKDNINKKTA
ncbi:MAG TPA: diguanylate cyclase, partial [Pseudomonadales bacterium]|nr:diguanylate cyclase [Pseudomonadales bacterium]